ncbi:MAG: NAD(P)/FAD-dependent oxidoreductase [Clostridia bacterium]|nr:NAD(P)/FAD-dependent oxidoreductase [Clostridia bacterium]NCC43380.1 NAD(P)/FAD-dependent oxidoreductase [Clostridia bacterium]
MINIIVIGGGASGLMASIQAARNGAQVTILEHNERVGKKILATGNGRCNLTNVYQEASCYRGSSPEYAWEIIKKFPMPETIRFFSELGIYTKNRNGWMYPYSDQASSVLEVLEMEARHLKVKIKTLEEAVDIIKQGNRYQVVTKTWKYDCDRVVISCGSSASNVEGSSDSGYTLAKRLGHSLVEPMPALAALKGKENYFAKWAGTRMDGIVKLEIEGCIFKEERGEILFTDYGISGIAVFQISRYAVRAVGEGCHVNCHLDLMPDFSKEDLINLLKKRLSDCPYKTIQEMMVGLVPKKMIAVLAPAKISLEDVAENMKDWVISVKDAYSMKQAQICSGGVLTEELTMDLESKLHPGIYFSGEVIDVDGPCGGYNLQWAWSSGAVAGISAANGSQI